MDAHEDTVDSLHDFFSFKKTDEKIVLLFYWLNIIDDAASLQYDGEEKLDSNDGLSEAESGYFFHSTGNSMVVRLWIS